MGGRHRYKAFWVADDGDQAGPKNHVLVAIGWSDAGLTVSTRGSMLHGAEVFHVPKAAEMRVAARTVAMDMDGWLPHVPSLVFKVHIPCGG
jgi:hypothetical protein